MRRNKGVPIRLGEIEPLGEMEPLGETDKYSLDVLEGEFLSESFLQKWFLPRKCASVSSGEDASRGKSAPSTLVRCRARQLAVYTELSHFGFTLTGTAPCTGTDPSPRSRGVLGRTLQTRTSREANCLPRHKSMQKTDGVFRGVAHYKLLGMP